MRGPNCCSRPHIRASPNAAKCDRSTPNCAGLTTRMADDGLEYFAFIVAEPSPLLVQLPQVVSPPAVENLPDGSEPVRTSCMFTASPRPLTVSPFSVSAVCFVMLTASECRSSTFFATMTPFALYQGPLPIRSRAFTPASPPGSVVLKYARQLVRVEPAALASERQCASAPSSSPKSAPLPLPTLVTRKSWGLVEPVPGRHRALPPWLQETKGRACFSSSFSLISVSSAEPPWMLLFR